MRTLALASIALLAALPACSIGMNLPPDFLQLQAAGGEFKAISTDEGRLWARRFPDPEHGTLAFWATTLQNELVQKRGYELLGSEAVRDAAGHDGTRFEFRANADGERYGYLVAVYVLPKPFPIYSEPRVLVVEFTAREAVFTQRLAAVKDAFATVDP